jgi:hypothetical protein
MTPEELQTYRKAYGLLRERLQRGKMEPFYKVNDKLWRWMGKNGVQKTSCPEWHRKYIEGGNCVRDGYFGIAYSAKEKVVSRRSRKNPTATLRPETFYLELPIDLVEKALALGFFP